LAGLIWIPTGDLETDASAATTINQLDFGFIQSGESKTLAFRIGSTDAIPLTYQLITVLDDSEPNAHEHIVANPADGSLGPGEISDTTTITVTLPVDEPSRSHFVVMLAVASDGQTYPLTITYEAVGSNEERRTEYPSRKSDFTDNISDVLFRLAEPIKVYTYHPIPFDPNDKRILIDATGRRNLSGDAGTHRFITQANVAERLSPESIWGYRRSESTILASFQSEHESVRINFEATNSGMTYNSTAMLYIPAEHQLIRYWALFAPARNPDREQFKRTVFLFKRQGDVWCVHNIYSRYRGNELSHYEAECVQVHASKMGSPDYFNPFALTYEHEIDKPYACFAVSPPDLQIILSDGSGSDGSASGSGSDSSDGEAPQSDDEYEEPAPDPDPDPPPPPILEFSIVGDDSIITVENLSVLELYSVENSAPGDVTWTILTFPTTIDLTMYWQYDPVTLPHTTPVELYLDAPGSIGSDFFELQAEDSVGHVDTIHVDITVTDAPPVLSSAQFTTSPRRVTAFFNESLQSFSNSGSMFDIRDDSNGVVTITSASCTGNNQVIIAITGINIPKTLNYNASGETLKALDDGALVASFNNELIT
jgi:hypothetical protein